MRNFFKDKFFWITGTIGLIFLVFTLHFRVNPFDGSVVPEYIQGTVAHVFLLIATMPAWIVGFIVSRVFPNSFLVVAFIIQFLIYGILCKIIRRGINFFKTQ